MNAYSTSVKIHRFPTREEMLENLEIARDIMGLLIIKQGDTWFITEVI